MSPHGLRLFFAVEIPPDVQAALARLQPDSEQRDYRWSAPELLHVTLVFLGNQPADGLPRLIQVAGVAAERSQAGTLRLGEPGTFGSRGAPRVLWYGLDGDVPTLRALQARLAADLRQAGVAFDAEPAYRPHITLARRRASARGGAPPDWPPDSTPHPSRFEMREVTLFESRLSPRGPMYHPLARLPLGEPAARRPADPR